MNNTNQTTHFGFKTVDWHEKEAKVTQVFHSVANNYDLMNDLMSFTLHRYWKQYTIALSYIRSGNIVLDLAGGSGDLTKLISKKVSTEGLVFLTDINQAMIAVGRDRLLDNGYNNNIHFVRANAQALPFANNYFNCITIGFGLRNITDKDQALEAMYQACKPGGQIIVLEFSSPTSAILKTLYDWYSFNILPKLGKIYANDSESYKYLVESIRMHPTQEELKIMIENHGFEDCYYRNLCGGIVAVHIAHKY